MLRAIEIGRKKPSIVYLSNVYVETLYRLLVVLRNTYIPQQNCEENNHKIKATVSSR